MSDIKLSVIFPVRVTSNRDYILHNLQRILSIKDNNENIEYIVVDSGSTSSLSKKIEKICMLADARYIYDDTRDQLFSAGRARDLGAQFSKGEFVLFLDVDIMFDQRFFSKIISEIKLRDMSKNITEYFCIPCFYLDKEFSAEFISSLEKRGDVVFKELKYNYENGVTNGIENFAPATSLTVINRWHFLSIGGHRKEFSGHGSEDFELTHRLATYARKYHRPYNYYLEKKNYTSVEYEGFRSYFSMAGYSVYDTQFVVHISHPRPKDKYQVTTQKNREILISSMKEFDQGLSKIEPLEDLTSKEVTLIFGVRKDTAWLSIRQLLPLLGKVDYISEMKIDLENIENLVRSRNITRFLFWNPYGNEKRLSIYFWARENKFPFLVFERGALPDSWFIDTGFNADSSSYDYSFWNRSINNEEVIDTEEYINSIIQSSNTLERNKNLYGKVIVKDKIDGQYRLGNRKILFIALQRPSDSVIKYFSGDAICFDNFIQTVNEVVEALDPYEWFVIIKKHPLEPGFPKELKETNNMLLVDDEYHIHDLLSISNKVFLINSGVGLLAMLFRKHVIYMGDIFYGHPSINTHATNTIDIINIINSSFKPSEANIIKFIYYLKNKFYSFAKAEYDLRVEKDGSSRSILKKLEFYQVKNINCSTEKVVYRDSPISLDSRVYTFFLPSIIRERRKNGKVFVSPIEVLQGCMKSIDLEGRKVSLNEIISKKKADGPILVTNEIAKNVLEERPTLPPVSKKNEKGNVISERLDSIKRKKNKFIRDPYNFFGDSKNSIINKGKYFYKNKKI